MLAGLNNIYIYVLACSPVDQDGIDLVKYGNPHYPANNKALPLVEVLAEIKQFDG